MIRPFTLHRPATVPEASRLLGELGSAALYCGGTELLQLMKMGFARLEHLIDVKGIAELHGIAATDGGLRIGAASTHREIERSPLARQRYPSLAEMERGVANVRVRNVGSLGGNLCFAEPHSDPATYLLGCDAVVELANAERRRRIGIADFITDAFATARAHDEVLVAVHLPAAPNGSGVAHRKLAFVERPTVSVTCRVIVADGAVRDARVAVGAIGNVPALLPAAARALVGVAVRDAERAADAAGRAAAETAEAADDLHGSAEYKRHLAGVLVRRAAMAALSEARRAA